MIFTIYDLKTKLLKGVKLGLEISSHALTKNIDEKCAGGWLSAGLKVNILQSVEV